MPTLSSILKEGGRINRNNFANISCTDKYQKHIQFLIPVVTYRRKNVVYKIIEAILS